MLNISISDGHTHISVCHQFILCAKIPLFNDSSKEITKYFFPKPLFSLIQVKKDGNKREYPRQEHG